VNILKSDTVLISKGNEFQTLELFTEKVVCPKLVLQYDILESRFVELLVTRMLSCLTINVLIVAQVLDD